MALGKKKATDNTPQQVPPPAAPLETQPKEPDNVFNAPDTPRHAGGNSLRLLLSGIGLLALVGLGIGVWSYTNSGSDDDTDTGTDTAAVNPAPNPAIGEPPPPTPVRVPVVVGSNKGPVAAATPGPATRRVPAGAAGIAPAEPRGPVLSPAVPGKPARLMPEKGAPTPVAPRPGLAGQPGRRGSRSSVVVARPVPPAVSADVRAQLKKLWKEGADAKHRNDYAGARRTWQKALKLAPGWPGFQDAIDALPKS